MNKKLKIVGIILGILIVIYISVVVIENKKNAASGTNKTFGVANLFPFGASSGASLTQGTAFSGGENATSSPSGVSAVQTDPHLVQLSTDPMAAAEITAQITTVPPDPTVPGAEPTYNINYIVSMLARATGHISEWFPATGQVTPITNTTIPSVQEAHFDQTGTNVILRYYDEGTDQIDTYSAEVLPDPASGLSRLAGNYLPYDISDLVVSPDKTRIFYVYPNNDDTIGITSDFNGANQKQVFSSKFSEWLLDWPTAQIVTATTKPSGLFPGFMYEIPSTTGVMQKVIGNITGLTTLTSPDGTEVLYADTSSGVPQLEVYTLATGTTLKLNAETFPEKCAWTTDSAYVYCGVPTSIPQGTYPDDWYQGKVQFSDQLWQYNVTTGIGYMLDDPTQSGKNLDITKMEIAPTKAFAVFTDKTTLTPWVYKQ